MCLISVLPKGTKKHSSRVTAFIKEGFTSNRDGSGFMYKKDGSRDITISKGYFNLNALLEEYNALELTERDEVVFHHRIGTSGAKNAANTHPFFINRDIIECTSNGTKQEIAVAHNGIFSTVDSYMKDGYSDTVAFASGYMTQLMLTDILTKDFRAFVNITKHTIGTQKLAYLLPDRDLILLGNFTEDEGYYHSNNGYKTYTYDYGGSSSHTSSNLLGYRSEDFYVEAFKNKEDKYIKHKKHFNKTSKTNNNNKLTNYNDLNYFLAECPELEYKSFHFSSLDINITEGNHRNFYFSLKDGVDFKGYEPNMLFEMTTWEPIDSHVLCILRRKDSTNAIGLSMKFINDNFNFIPKFEFISLYKDLKYIDFNLSPSKNLLKTIFKKLTGKKSIHRTDFSKFNLRDISASRFAWKEYYNLHSNLIDKAGSSKFKQIIKVTEGFNKDIISLNNILEDNNVVAAI